MKKFILCFILFTFVLLGCRSEKTNIDAEKIVEKIIEQIDLPGQTLENLSFPSSYTIDNIQIEVNWLTSDEEIITKEGIVTRGVIDKDVLIKIQINVNDQIIEKEIGYVTIKSYSDEYIQNEIKSQINIPNETESDLSLPESITIINQEVQLIWTSDNENIISHEGFINQKTYVQSATLTVQAIFADKTLEFEFGQIYVTAATPLDIINKAIAKVEVPTSTKTDINLPTRVDGVSIFWESSNTNVLSKTGKWFFSNNEATITLSATFFYSNITVDKEYSILVQTYNDHERLQLIYDSVSLPAETKTNLQLPTSFNYFVTGEWLTNNPNIITNTGVIGNPNEDTFVNLILKLYSGDQIMEKDFTVKVPKAQTNNQHMFVQKVEDFNVSHFNNLEIKEGKILLSENAVIGSYESNVFETLNYNRLVGSWAAFSSINGTCELQIKVRVNGQWSPYLTYSQWGFGRNNAMNDQTNAISKMSDDEVLISDNKYADAFQFKITLRRDTISHQSPKLSLVAITLTIPNYVFDVDVSSLPKMVDYDVPKLYQHDVPNIGNSICSITSSAMLLMFKGHTFSTALPHGELAPLFYDYGNKIYGNWVYNTVGMGAYGENSYVKKIYSFAELQYHLVNVGPVALSIKGNTGLYTTNGHLIVVRGYEITDNGTYIICNDPNVRGVYVKYSLEIFNAVSRNIIYVVE